MNRKAEKAMYAKLRELSRNSPSEWKSEKEYWKYAHSEQGKKDVNDYNKQYLKILYHKRTQGENVNQMQIDQIKKAIW